MTIKTLIKNSKTSSMNLPTPSNLSFWWNLGSMIGISLIIQIITGLILSMNYCPNTNLAFQSIIHITNDTYMGWTVRNIHINGASMFFFTMYLHISRGLYNSSFVLVYTWLSGLMILLLTMTAAFMGYILPWGQMSYWGATVITNLLSVIPYIGTPCVEWLWGGFSVNNSTLNRFYSLHFIIPFIIMLMVTIHLMALHWTGSSNPMGIKSTSYMIPFSPYYTFKDTFSMLIMMQMIIFISTIYPDMLTDPENFSIANPLMTPHHIKPEWYFLHSYAILRSIPNKMGGVVCLIMSIMILILPAILPPPKMKSLKFYPTASSLFWTMINTTITLMWLGGKPMMHPYTVLAQMLSLVYFMYFPLSTLIMFTWDQHLMNYYKKSALKNKFNKANPKFSTKKLNKSKTMKLNSSKNDEMMKQLMYDDV